MIAMGSSQRIGNSTYRWNRKADHDALFPLWRRDLPQGRAILPQGWAFYLKVGLLFQTVIKNKSSMVMPAMGCGAKGQKFFKRCKISRSRLNPRPALAGKKLKNGCLRHPAPGRRTVSSSQAAPLIRLWPSAGCSEIPDWRDQSRQLSQRS